MKNTVPTSQRLISRRIIWGLLFVCYTEVSHVYPPLPTAVIIFAFRAGPTSPIKIKLTLLLAIAFTNRVIIQLQLWACSTKTTFLPNRFCRCFQESQVVSWRNIFAEEQMQHHQRGDNGCDIYRHHYRRILSETQPKEVCRNDVN